MENKIQKKSKRMYCSLKSYTNIGSTRFYKKADMPFWLIMMIWMLLGLIVILAIIMIEKNKLFSFLDWLG